MPQTLRTDGDPIERAHIGLIEARFPSYGRLWSERIGNDGRSRLPLQEAFDDSINDRRQFTSQYVYTALVCVICADRVARNLPKISTLPDYLDTISQLVAFYGHLGRLRDSIERVGAIWKIHDLASPLEGLYQERNGALHDFLSPMTELYDAVIFVPPGEGKGEWSRRSKWSDSNTLDFKPIADHLQEKLNQTMDVLEGTFSRLYSKVCDEAPDLVRRMRSLQPSETPPILPSGSATPGMVFGNWDLDNLKLHDD
jgi:hypothetical protein